MSIAVGEPLRHPLDEPVLSIVMPVLNEAETLRACIEKADRAATRIGLPFEIIVADNGSSDGSQQLAQSLGARVVDVRQRGYGSALIDGIAAARGRYVLMGDADDSYDFTAIAPFVERLEAGAELVIGNRFHGGIESGAMPWLHQRIGNPVLSFLGRRMFGASCRDIYCGLRGFRRDVVQRLELRSSGMEFALEMVAKASLYGLRVEEVATTLSRDGRSRKPHLRTWRDGWRSLRFFLLYSPNWLFLFPGLLLIGLGILGIALVAPGPLLIGGTRFDVHTMLYCAIAVIIGMQAVQFAVFARVFAVTEGLLPPSPLVARLSASRPLEWGLFVGGIFLVLGAAGSVWALLEWESGGFGPLDYASTMRKVIPSGLLLACGAQTILGSFFLSILGLRTTRDRRGASDLTD